MTGRPNDFTPEIANEICDRLARGESLRAICADDESGWLPTARTVHRWLTMEDDWAVAFRQQYAHAREVQADYYAEEIISIADQPNKLTTADGAVIESDPQRDRLRVDARKWYASKLAPKKYGDRVAHVGGGSDDEPIRTRMDMSGLTTEQLQALASIPSG